MAVLSRPLGTQIVAEIYECDPNALNDVEKVKDMMIAAAQAAGAEIRETVFHKFEPQGVSGVVVISESHLTIHTWPELGYAAVDIFTCGEKVDPWDSCEYITKALNAEEVNVMEISRGMKNLRHNRKKRFDQTH